MSGQLAFVVQPNAETLRRLSKALSEAGFKVLGAGSGQEALDQLEKLIFLPPDVILAPLTGPRANGSDLLSHLREHPLTRKTPVAVLSEGDGDERRQALRLGLSHVVPAPYESEELVLTVRLALTQHRDERLLSGSLEQMPVPDLLQTLETSRRTGTIVLKSHGLLGTLWLRDGRVIDAEIEGGARGQEAVFSAATWEQGTFEAEFRAIAVPERIFDSTSFLLLEAMRRRDEQYHEENPPYAAIPDPPPRPPLAVLAVHRPRRSPRHDRYGIDGRDPNSYSGIFWCLGRYDRAWGPDRPIFGKVRYMSCESTRRKLHAKAYLRKFGNRIDQGVLSW